MAFSIVQHTTNNGTGTTASVTCSATTAGNLLVGIVGVGNNPGSATISSGPAGWSQVGTTIHDVGFFDIFGGVFYLPNCASGSTSFSWTLTASPGQWDIMFLEISGVATSSPLDVSGFSNTGTEHTSDSKSITTTANGDLILGLVVYDLGNQTVSAISDGTGYTSIATFTDVGGWMTLHAAWQTQTTAGSISYAPTWTGLADDILWAISFKAAGGGGNNITGKANTRFVESIVSKGRSRSKFPISIASKEGVRAKFTTSIGQKGAVRSKYTEAIGQKGLIRSKFTESIGQIGRIRSKFFSAAVSKSQARSRFYEAIPQKSSARAKFLLSIGQKAATRAKFLISKASRGLARAKFTEAIGQRGQARAKFSLSAVIKGIASSTFKIAVAGGHAITAYMRSRYKVSIRQTQAQRSRFLIRFSQSGLARSLSKIATKTSAQARSRFQIRFSNSVIARARFVTAIRQSARARSRYVSRIAQVAAARGRFLVQGILITYPIKSIVHTVSQALVAAWKSLPTLNLLSSRAQSLNITHQGSPMATPNSTITSTITVTDVTGALVSNASAVSLVAYFPDGTSTSYSLTSGITNQGNGQYQAKYNTKMAGIIREVWSIVGADGTTLSSAQFDVAVEY